MSDKEKYASLTEVIPYIGKDRKKLESILQSKGMRDRQCSFFVTLLEEDWNLCQESDSVKYWALAHGFMPGRVSLYGLTDENYTDYISDFDYFRVHPFNNHFAIWINDKVTLKYTIPSMFRTLEGRDLSIMPEYYLYIENDGYYSYLMDSPQQLPRDEDYLLNLLKDKKTLALKPSRGTCGYGFVRLEYDDGMIRANGKVLDEQAFKKFEKGLNGYIVTEYIYQHPLLDRVWKDSVCTLRVIALKNRQDIFDGGRIDVIASYARFGTNKSHGASNLSSGGGRSTL